MGRSAAEKAKRKAEKAALKDSETPEEKRARRLEKKRKKHGNVPADTFGHDNTDNRFGDANLSDQFVWGKKIDKMVSQGEDPRKLTDPKFQRQRKQELKEEIIKLKARREEREQEKAMMEEERERMMREKEMLSYADWEQKEDQFHLSQAKVRTEIRIKENRARPIDVLAKNLLLNENFDMEMTEPYKIFRGLPKTEVSDLRQEIEQQLALGDHQKYWSSLLVICDDELERHRSMEEGGDDAMAGDHGVHSSVSADINTMFQGKTSRELEELDEQIKGHISGGLAADVEYWENLGKRLQIHKAKASLREFHQDLLQKRLRKLTSENSVMRDGEAAAPESDDEETAVADGQASDGDDDEQDGGWSPVLLSACPEGDEDLVMDDQEDIEELEQLRKAVAAEEKINMDSDMVAAHNEGATGEADALFSRELAKAREEADDGEVDFGDEVALPGGGDVYHWHDKYRPRKPRYFNRVHTGYEWNKYNQTHYDHDNPPPKVVQGYKFNVFYPDLIDKAKAPTFHVNPDPDGNPELCVIRFHAGPPYEDIAFKVVNREWEYSHKKGYKSTFDRGIMHLFFNFKRHRYRR